jgi:hypothetical protein
MSRAISSCKAHRGYFEPFESAVTRDWPAALSAAQQSVLRCRRSDGCSRRGLQRLGRNEPLLEWFIWLSIKMSSHLVGGLMAHKQHHLELVPVTRFHSRSRVSSR